MSVSIFGKLTKDFEIRYTSNGKTLAISDLAQSRKKDNGEWETIFVHLAVWGENADLAVKHLKKGDKVIVYGTVSVKPFDKGGEIIQQPNMNVYRIGPDIFSLGEDVSERVSTVRVELPVIVQRERDYSQRYEKDNDEEMPF